MNTAHSYTHQIFSKRYWKTSKIYEFFWSNISLRDLFLFLQEKLPCCSYITIRIDTTDFTKWQENLPDNLLSATDWLLITGGRWVCPNYCLFVAGEVWGVRCEVDANVYDGREVWLTSIVIPVQTWTLWSVKHIIVHSFSHAINIFKRNTNITEIYLTVMYLTEMYRAVPHFCNCIIGFNGSRTSFTYFFNTTLENPL